ncbi:hypothetical protein Goklo_010104 [Gossypium klotzschianum]|uniref:Uncharacterized protein n=1 Tax=Gossypium klotzschianum TaxID=34286 RepID=A0A7J8V563_9ROSI|nr:hypothetical protein [Gossypium klotzschianum]
MGSRDRGGGDDPKCVGLGTAGQLPGQSCFTNPSMGCGIMCFARNVGCTTTCSIIEFPDP